MPLRTSFYIVLATAKEAGHDAILADSVAIRLTPGGGEPIDVLSPGRRFGAGYSGRLFATPDRNVGTTLVVYITSDVALQPSTTYGVQVTARSRNGSELPATEGTWQFTTEAGPTARDLGFDLDLGSTGAGSVHWHGAFFSGFCKPSFCTSDPTLISTYELMDEVRKQYPRAWTLQRDFWMTGMPRQPSFFPDNLPGVVRERETRRITAIDARSDGTLLHVEDFFGYMQYGIGPGTRRPLSDGYRPGDEVLIADTVHDARAKVLAADDERGTVLVSRVDTPAGGWRIEYAGRLPRQEDPKAPGLFPPGGCHLIKARPVGTPCYYWDRLDKEHDLAHRRFRRRLMPNFADAPGDLAIDGRNWTTAKDYPQLHEVTRTITSHLIERYGDATLDFVWSVFNEPDLGALFWRSDWNELQKFYDYTTDAVLRAFEDHGYDSNRVFIGGLELGGIFGTNLRIREFLAHCSPRAQAAGALPLNAAFADAGLDGKRSRRVETLCGALAGKGSPCDFVSIHAYNRSALMAAKLARAKEIALEVDPEYYAKLWVNSHESCPDWNPPPDPAATDSYLGNGYFETWCADVARRQLQRAAEDARYAYGETILTIWPWPNENFGGANGVTRAINVDDDGDGKKDRTVVIAMPILHFLGLLSSMGDACWVLPERTIGGHVVSGLAGRTERDVRVLLYTHNALDTQSRCDHSFQIKLSLAGLAWDRVRITEYRFDRDHNSYFRVAEKLRDRAAATGATGGADATGGSDATGSAGSTGPLIGGSAGAEPTGATHPSVGGPAGRRTSAPSSQRATDIDAIIEMLESDPGTHRREDMLAALQKLPTFGPAARRASSSIIRFLDNVKAEPVRAAAAQALFQVAAFAECYSSQEVQQVQELSALRPTGSSTTTAGTDGRVHVNVDLAANGASFLVIEPEAK